MYNFFGLFKGHAVLATTIAVLAVVGTVIAGRVANRDTVDTSGTNIKQVSLVEVRTFRTGLSTVSADGVVESVSQVDLKSQVSAPLSSVTVSIGDSVYAGQVIAELSNADIRAQLDQSRASLALALSQYSTSGVTLESARRNAIEKIRDAYAKADTAINAQIEEILFTQVGTVSALSDLIANPILHDQVVITHDTISNVTLPNWKRNIDALSVNSTDRELISALKFSRARLDEINVLLDTISVAINDISKTAPQFILSVISNWKTSVATTRTSVNASIAALTTAEASLAGADVGQNSSAQAQVGAARAGVNNLEAQLAKTIIRSPIAGKIASLPLRTGELATPGQLIATVVGSGGLHIKAFASGEDFARIQKNARVTIENSIPGTVTSVAPSVNQTTKKVEVKITVTNPGASGLVVGQNVQALIEAGSTLVPATVDASYLLPMQNVKIVPGDAYVLTVDSDSKIEKRSVILGNVRGEFIEVKGGLSDDMKIVSPVYELNPGETVRIQ